MMNPNKICSVFLFSIVLLLTSSALAERFRLPRGVSIDRLIVYKAERQLEAYSGDELIGSWDVYIGRGGEGPKRYEGDERTPEGIYRIDRRHYSRLYRRFLHVSYPNEEDLAAYREGLANRTIPAGVGIGGMVGIHGWHRDWTQLPEDYFGTAGCIMLDNEVVLELFRAVVDQAIIEIHPSRSSAASPSVQTESVGERQEDESADSSQEAPELADSDSEPNNPDQRAQ